MICPRCYGSPAVVCCALCQDAKRVPEALAAQYRQWMNVGEAIALRERFKTSAKAR